MQTIRDLDILIKENRLSQSSVKTQFILFLAFIPVIAINCSKKEDHLSVQQPGDKKWVVSTVAGDGTRAFANGPAQFAKFSAPYDVVVKSDGTIDIADAGNHRIREITAGIITTFAGNNSTGIVNANGGLAQFRYPYHMALDKEENLYILDINDSHLRNVSPSADVSFYAGEDASGFADGPSADAKFSMSDGGVVTDTLGNLYIADINNQRIRKISLNGQVTTIAGTGTSGFKNGSGTTALFNQPSAIAIDDYGNLYVADALNFRIRKITAAGEVSTFAGSGVPGHVDGGPGSAQFNYINDLVIDAQGNLYVADENRIRKITPQGFVSTIAGSDSGYADGDGASAKFNDPGGLGIDIRGNIYVADTGNNRIRKISFE